MRIVVAGGPLTGKTTLAAALALHHGGIIRHTDDLIKLHDWSAASEAASRWFDEPGDFIIEGVAVPRAIRKWMLRNLVGKPCDRLVWLAPAFHRLTPGQMTMTRGCWTVFKEIRPDLERRGVEIEMPPDTI